MKDSEKRIIEIDQCNPGLSREYLLKGAKDTHVQAYYKLMVDIAVLMGADRKSAHKEMKKVLSMEIKMAEFALPRELRRNWTLLHNPMKIRDLQFLYPELPMVQFLNDVIEHKEAVIYEDEVVNVNVPSYVIRLRDYLKNVPSRVQANYMMWRFVKSLIIFLNKKALGYAQDFISLLSGSKSDEPRWEKCVRVRQIYVKMNQESFLYQATAGLDDLYYVEGSLTNAVGSMYAKSYFKLDAKLKADKMVSNMKLMFKHMLDKLDWMDDKTRARAHAKADKMMSFIAYKEEILDDDLINQFYEGLDITSTSFMKNYLNLRRFIGHYYAKEFRKKIDKLDWRTHGGAAMVNAFYDYDENSIQFPAAVLGGVFFDAERPSYMNYGSLGYVVGHEITHGFDDQGRRGNHKGN